jgi:pimeloyl-ACP methyl ester carboxylesterase
VTEFPVFIPFEDRQLATVVTVPDDRPRALVLLLQGLGSPRAHRYGLWTRAARALAEKGIASARFDFPGMGDSTGAVRVRLDRPPAPETIAVAETVMDAIGVNTFGVIGNCVGGRTSFEVAARVDSCISAISLGNPKGILQGEGRAAPHKVAHRVARKVPKVAKLVRRVVKTESIQPRVKFVSRVQETIRTSHVLFLLLHSGSAHAIESRVSALAASSGKKAEFRTEVQTIDVEGSNNFQIPVGSQPAVIDALVQWMDETMPKIESTAVAHGSS